MSGKRTATSDLNHDNWNDEAEPEEAGTFSHASQDELKGRVIKKAKRRIAANSDAAPSVFAGFGGFKSTAAPAAGNLFGFLSKPDATASSMAPAAAAESVLAAKSPSVGDGKAAAPTGFAGFQGFSNGNSGKWECSSCMVFNPNDKDVCACCSTPRPGATAKASAAPSFSFGVKTTSPASMTSEPASGFAGFAGFNKSNADKWTCGDCMVQNKNDVDTCPCCGSTRPGAEPKKAAPAAAQASGFSFGFKPETTAAPTLATGTFTFGKPSESSAGAATGFTFGVKKESSAPPTGFSFGAKSDATTTPASTFSFGAKSEAGSAASSPATGFSFGVTKPLTQASPSTEKTTEAKSTPSKDSSSPDSKANSTAFCMKLKALNQQLSDWIKLHVDQDPVVILRPIFKDYEKHLSELESKYGVNADSASRSGTDRIAGIAQSESKSEQKSSKLDDSSSAGFKFGAVASASAASPAAPAFSFGSAAKPTVDRPASEAAGGFSFGSGSQSTESSKAGLFTFGSDSKATKSTFSFGDSSSQKPASSGQFVFGDAAKASPATGFSFGAPGASTPSFAFTPASSTAPSEENTQDADQEEDDEPPKVEVNTVVEEDAIHSVKCKLFYKKEKEFKDKGVGMLHLKRVDGNKTQMVIRAETNLGNILLNILVNDKMSFTKRNNNVQFVCVPNPPIANMEGPVPMLVRVKTADMAEELIKKLEEAAA